MLELMILISIFLFQFPIVSPYENEPVIMLLMRIMKFACANVDICDIDLRRINSAFVRNLLIEYRTEFKRRLFPYSQEREILAVVRYVLFYYKSSLDKKI